MCSIRAKTYRTLRNQLFGECKPMSIAGCRNAAYADTPITLNELKGWEETNINRKFGTVEKHPAFSVVQL
jgi:hypothetical protein